ncbi:MAG: hypothetical protein ABI853_00680, partial [Sphingomicrobium sp.]
STLAVTAFQARNEAREQRREAEGLVAFMLGDLKDKLEPIGRLDALDGVGSRVLSYYSKQDASELTDAALSQRSKALSLMAQVADARGDSQTAVKLYRQAMAGTAEAVRRNPTDAQAIFDHAQNVFYVGEIAQNRGDLPTAEASMREYRRLALQMVALQPDSMKYRMEQQYADTDLGVVLFLQRRFAEAVTQFKDALATMDAISTADPANDGYRKSVAESLAWLADAERAAGKYPEAIAARQRDIALLESLLGESGSVDYRQRLIPARTAFGNLYADTGQRELASAQFRAAIDDADKLSAVEPNNAKWREYGFYAQMALADHMLANGRPQDAVAPADESCAAVQSLLARKVPIAWGRAGMNACWAIRARIALATGQNAAALDNARQALSSALAVRTSDPVADRFSVAKAYRRLGDAERTGGDANAAIAAWKSALTALPQSGSEKPAEMDEHATILRRLGRSAEAQQLNQRLFGMGYRLREVKGD